MQTSQDKDEFFEIYGDEGSQDSLSSRDNFSSDSEDDDDADAFEWTDGEFLPAPLEFLSNQVGFEPSIVDSVTNKTPFECFSIFVDKSMIQLIVKQTNLFAKQVKDNSGVGKKKANNYKKATMKDIYVFLSLTLLMAHIRKNRMQDYWAVDEYITTPIFPKVMARDRYWELWTYLHFNDNSLNPNASRLFKIEPIVEMLKAKFSQVLKPYQNLCIDESLLLFKGRLKFKQYLPKKRKRFGIKSYVLCDCKTGFILDFYIYLGKDSKNSGSKIGKSGEVVMQLMEGHLNQGHILFVDNWYTSCALFEELRQNGTGACGTVKRNRKNYPVFPTDLKKGEMITKHTKHQLAMCWKDKRQVYMLSTVHSDAMVPQAEGKVSKPLAILDYNNNMGLVDKSDMQMSFNDTTRRSMKWYKKLFFRLVDVAIYNAYLLYKYVHQEPTLPLSSFRLELIKEICKKFCGKRTEPGRPAGNNVKRLIGKHYISSIAGRRKRRRCYVCSNTTRRQKKRTDTRFECKECNVGLCIEPCFQNFHSLQFF